MMPDIKSNLALVRGRIDDACRASSREPGEVTLVAVSKRQDLDLVKLAIAAGQVDFGENQVQAMLQRIKDLGREGIRWHLIGNLQSNKGKQAIAADSLHGIGSLKAAKAVSKALENEEGSRSLPILVQVNISKEDSKSGLASEALEEALLQIRQLPSLNLVGLMCIPDRNAGRQGFSALRELRDQMRSATGLALPDLSMGMSGDYEDAILEGATIVRVGRAIFGERLA
jgi:pyridoxal phosphate enzyme (YggS family)